MKYVTKRIFIMAVTLFLVSLLTFLVFALIPGNSGRLLLGIDATDQAVAEFNAKHGLDKPVIERFFTWATNAFKGDLGESYSYSQPVTTLILQKVPYTLTLAIMSLLMIILVSIPLAIMAANREHSFFDNALMLNGQVMMAIPNFFLGIILSWLFGLVLKIFVPGSIGSYKTNLGGFLYYMIFPALSLAIPRIAMSFRFLRTSIIEQKNSLYVRTAKGIGLGKKEIMNKHILPNAFLPFVTFVGILFAEIVAGSVVLEQVFAIPGVGRFLLEAIELKDIPLAQGMILYIAFSVVIISFIVDIIYKLLDPRVRV